MKNNIGETVSKVVEDLEKRIKELVSSLKDAEQRRGYWYREYQKLQQRSDKVLRKAWTANRFSPEVVKMLCGGKFPKTGFSWDCAEYFKFEDGAFEAYSGDEVLPAPSIPFKISEVEFTI